MSTKKEKVELQTKINNIFKNSCFIRYSNILLNTKLLVLSLKTSYFTVFNHSTSINNSVYLPIKDVLIKNHPLVKKRTSLIKNHNLQ